MEGNNELRQVLRASILFSYCSDLQWSFTVFIYFYPSRTTLQCSLAMIIMTIGKGRTEKTLFQKGRSESKKFGNRSHIMMSTAMRPKVVHLFNFQKSFGKVFF